MSRNCQQCKGEIDPNLQYNCLDCAELNHNCPGFVSTAEVQKCTIHKTLLVVKAQLRGYLNRLKHTSTKEEKKLIDKILEFTDTISMKGVK